MKVVIASDHGGYEYKQSLLHEIGEKGYDLKDLGAFDDQPSDYPDYAEAVANAILSGEAQKGILICGSGIGVAVAANKFKGIRAGVCHDTYSAHQGVEHDDMNIVCMGQRVIGIELARDIIFTFLAAVFSKEIRHKRRLEKINAIEARNMK